MYKPVVLGASTTAPAAAVLPATGSNKALFISALALLAVGIVILATSVLVARKSHA